MQDLMETIKVLEERYATVEIEECLDRLNAISKEMQSGELPLSRALSLYAEGVVLIRRAREILKNTYMSVNALKKLEEGYELEEIDIDMKKE